MPPVLIVTGGSRGIGAATVRLAAQAGYAVCIGYRRDARAAQQRVDEALAYGVDALAVPLDVAQEADVLNLFDAVDRRWGRLDGLVNNAGVLDRQCRLDDLSVDRVQRILSTNVLGSILCAREAVRRMATDRGGQGGAIVNLSSVAAKLGAPFEYVDYAASKAAVNTLTIGLAKEVAHRGIRVNAVSPGVIDTDIHASGGEPGRVQRVAPSVPMQRGGTPDEVAQAILWLLSPQASYVTGTILDVSGGR